jgi:hypothetical protein
MKPELDHPSLHFDVLAFVHVGICLPTNYGRFAKYGWPVKKAVELYILPVEKIRTWIMSPKYINPGRVELYWNRRPFADGSKQELGQTREILGYLNRYDILDSAIASSQLA